MTEALWTEVDAYISTMLVPSDASLDAALEASEAAGLPQIAVTPAQGKLLLEGLSPLAAEGWTWSENSVGVHVLLRHKDGQHVRAVAARTDLDLALLSRYRAAKEPDDGLFLRFGALDPKGMQAGVEELLGGRARRPLIYRRRPPSRTSVPVSAAFRGY